MDKDGPLFYIPLSKAEETPEGDWLLHGPVSMPTPDLEGEVLVREGVKRGLEALQKGQKGKNWVDWHHQWDRTHDPKFLVGRGVAWHEDEAGNPVLVTRLRKSSELAREAKAMMDEYAEHISKGQTDEPSPLGYSVYGRRLRRKGDQTHEVDISRISLTPDHVHPDCQVRWGDYVEKALEAGTGADAAAFTGGRALTFESLAAKLANVREPRNRKTKPGARCRECGAAMRKGARYCVQCGTPRRGSRMRKAAGKHEVRMIRPLRGLARARRGGE